MLLDPGSEDNPVQRKFVGHFDTKYKFRSSGEWLDIQGVEQVLSRSLNLDLVHPGAILTVYDTFGGHKKATEAFLDYLPRSGEYAPPAILRLEAIENCLKTIRTLDRANDDIVEKLGLGLADAVLGNPDDNPIRQIVVKMLWKTEEQEPDQSGQSSEPQLQFTKDSLKTSMGSAHWHESCWSDMKGKPGLFRFVKMNGEEQVRLGIKWWKFSRWWTTEPKGA